jgi:nitrogen regulatory protein P-II 1
MIMIEAIVREEKLDAVMTALNQIEVSGITVYQVMGWGQQKGFTEHVRSIEVEVRLIPKILFKLAVANQEVAQNAIEVIRKAACTGTIGDGKIFSYDIRDALRIRTGETGIDAL